ENQNSIPSGYPTESKTVSAPFSMADAKTKHFGMDFASNGKNIPVSATADGIVMAAEFALDKGYYVKINHMNGFITLYAHLSELDVKAGDKVEKGDVLGLTGATGMATGIHCHYEIQLNGIYQDPAKYL
ncbi:MAG: M23 family metallopeptidase, partial [Anaerotignum sp.]